MKPNISQRVYELRLTDTQRESVDNYFVREAIALEVGRLESESS